MMSFGELYHKSNTHNLFNELQKPFRPPGIYRTGGPGVQLTSADGITFRDSVVNQTGSAIDSRNRKRGSGLWVWNTSSGNVSGQNIKIPTLYLVESGAILVDS